MPICHIHNYKYGSLAFKDKEGCKHFFNSNTNTYQEYVNDEFRKYFVPKTNILDVGSNIGIFTVSFSKIASDCKVHSFEAVSTTRKLLTKSVELNKLENIDIYDFGLSDENKKININIDCDNLGNSSISQDLHEIDKMKNLPLRNVKKKVIEVKKLDDLKIDNISFIKVDIQEHELEFLKGAKETLKNNNATVILEIPRRSEIEIKIHDDCVKLMKELGYNHYRICIGASKDYIFRKDSF